MRNLTTTLRKFLAAVLFMLPALSMTAQQPVLSENFEAWDGVTADWLPEGWSEINTNAEQAAMNDGIFTWQVASKRTGQTIPDAVEGSRFAIVYYAYGYDENNRRVDLAQDEWLVSPQFAVQAGDSLLFQLGYSPLYLFDLNNENINCGCSCGSCDFYVHMLYNACRTDIQPVFVFQILRRRKNAFKNNNFSFCNNDCVFCVYRHFCSERRSKRA